MTEDDYREVGRFIWKNYVPKSGQSDTVQGELLRSNEKLRDECQRNGNINWDSGHEILANYILTTLTESSDVSEDAKDELKCDIERVLEFEYPYTEDDLFDRTERKIFDWYLANKEPIPRTHNPDLRR
ncbi:hypothetical protein [Roseibacillus persicicus]|uniref:hypothetical protein n=1 Tax=Roseibacillus persicicus TaxID=454148 RepID=UPI002810594D|nr:hypothetical protein [Roseibacillus persicicus]MDQ8192660.1 hypothetical protein [Roseibacillus persicicus]